MKKAKKLLIDGLSKDIILDCDETEPHYYHGWMKVKDKKSHVYPDDSILKENGVWIDLYKLVKVKKSDVEYVCLKEHLDYLNRRLKAGGLTKQEYNKRITENDLYNKISEELVKKTTQRSKVSHILYGLHQKLFWRKIGYCL